MAAERIRPLLLGLAALTLAGCGGGETRASAAADSVSVGLVLSSGGRGDRGFNDAALTGLAAAATELGADTAVTETAGGEGKPDDLRRYA
ncbi:MAG TPA: hypothetical protein VIB55_23350, partial [Longimicrobium sp.]